MLLFPIWSYPVDVIDVIFLYTYVYQNPPTDFVLLLECFQGTLHPSVINCDTAKGNIWSQIGMLFSK
jgi:hypothetical protein